MFSGGAMVRRLFGGSMTLIAAAALVGLVGCSADGEAGSRPAPPQGALPPATMSSLRDALAATTSVSTQRVAMTATVKGLSTPAPIVVTADGQFDNDDQRGRMTIDASDLIGVVPSSAGASNGTSDGRGDVELVVDGSTTFVDSPLVRNPRKGGERWLKLDPADLELSPVLGGGASTNPAGFLALFDGARKVVGMGPEVVRSVKTTHLATVLDVEALTYGADLANPDPLLRQLIGIAAFGIIPALMPAEIWIDADGMVRKLSITIELTSLDNEDPLPLDGGELTMALELYDFDQRVEVSVPPAEDVGAFDPSIFDD